MNAKQARFLSEKSSHQTFEEHLAEAVASAEKPEDFLADVIWNCAVEAIQTRAREGRRSLMFEPFVIIPAKLYNAEQESGIIGRIVCRLQAEGYEGVEWDRRDKRVVMQIKW